MYVQKLNTSVKTPYAQRESFSVIFMSMYKS